MSAIAGRISGVGDRVSGEEGATLANIDWVGDVCGCGNQFCGDEMGVSPKPETRYPKPDLSGGAINFGTRFSERNRSRTTASTMWNTAWPSRKRTSALVGCTLTSTASGGNSTKRNQTG